MVVVNADDHRTDTCEDVILYKENAHMEIGAIESWLQVSNQIKRRKVIAIGATVDEH